MQTHKKGFDFGNGGPGGVRVLNVLTSNTCIPVIIKVS